MLLQIFRSKAVNEQLTKIIKYNANKKIIICEWNKITALSCIKQKRKKFTKDNFEKKLIQTFSMGITKKDPPPAVSVAIAINLGLTAQKELSWAFFVILIQS